MKKILLLTALAAIISPSASYAETPENLYNQYIATTKTATDFNALNIFISQATLTARNEYIERVMQKNSKSRNDIETMLLERAKYRENCTKDRKLIAQKALSANTHMLTYRFKDGCNQNPGAIVATIAEVTMVKEGNQWKVDNTSARPEQPTAIKKVIPLQ